MAPRIKPGQDVGLYGEAVNAEAASKLHGKWGAPPFSVLLANGGEWAKRKRELLSLGFRSEEGRGDNLLKMSDTMLEPDPEKRAAKKAMGKAFNTTDWIKENGKPGDAAHDGAPLANGTSIFDPVLAENAYTWFCPKGGRILDPFAGGSVRGLVAAISERHYFGCDLRAEQIAANQRQAAEIPDAAKWNRLERGNLAAYPPIWHCGDSRQIIHHVGQYPIIDKPFDMIFSCPPYADLEVYSDDPADLSTLAYADFRAAYFDIIKKSCLMLRQDAFACFVIGEVRDKKGIYYNFVGDTIEAFQAAGLAYYNEMILVTATGTAAMRADKQFMSSRCCVKGHQNVLVFVKGDRKIAAQRINESEGLEKGTGV